MKQVIVDTSALVAFFVRADKNHSIAQSYVAQHPATRWIILETVFDEFVTWLRAKSSISTSIQIGRVLRTEHIYVNISNADDAATWDIFCRYDQDLRRFQVPGTSESAGHLKPA